MRLHPYTQLQRDFALIAGVTFCRKQSALLASPPVATNDVASIVWRSHCHDKCVITKSCASCKAFIPYVNSHLLIIANFLSLDGIVATVINTVRQLT